MIFLAGTFFLNIYVDSMISSKAFEKQYVLINSSFLILKNILLSIAMLMKHDELTNTPTIFPEEKLNADWNQSL